MANRTHIKLHLCHRQYTLLNDCVSYKVFDTILDEKFSYDAHAHNAEFAKEFAVLAMATGAKIRDELENVLTASPTKLYVTVHNNTKCVRIKPRQRNVAAIVDETIKRVRAVAAEIAHMRNPLYDIPVAIATHFADGTTQTLTMPLCHYMPGETDLLPISRWSMCYKNMPFTIHAVYIGDIYRISLSLFEHEFTKKTARIDMYCARVHVALAIEYSGNRRRIMFERNVMRIVKEFL